MNPLCIDLFCGLGGWTEGFIAEGYTVIGFDNHRHEYGEAKYPGQLVIQDVLTIHGSQFKDAAVIVASPPCQNYSYLAMPWSRSTNPDNSKSAKALRLKWETEGPDNRLFNACFRIQREAIEARSVVVNCGCREMTVFQPLEEKIWSLSCARCFIPLIVENVRGAIPWVGRSAWNYGSFHLWGDVPALMPINLMRRMKSRIDCAPRMFSDRVASTPEEAHALHYRMPVEGQKQNPDGTYRPAGSWFRIADSSQGDRGPAGQKVAQENAEGTKIGGDWFSDSNSTCRKHGSKSSARKAASAQIAKIPFPLSSHIAQVYKPKESA